MNIDKELLFKRWDFLCDKPMRYLTKIGFYDKLDKGEINAYEVEKIFYENIKKYFKGERNQYFILGMGHIFYELYCDIEPAVKLFDILCDIDNLCFDFVRNKRPKISTRERDKVIRESFKILEQLLT